MIKPSTAPSIKIRFLVGDEGASGGVAYSNTLNVFSSKPAARYLDLTCSISTLYVAYAILASRVNFAKSSALVA